ncbi:MAG: PKD domain-containing protein [Myxococcales bacterium]|nr:PKD domain-containing protein [Myxococcales bacterium]
MRALSLSPLLLLATQAFAASGGPDTYGYYYIDSSTSGGPTYDSTVISTALASGTILGTAPSTGASFADDASTSFTLPFTFDFYGTSYSTAYAGSNGYVTFASYTTYSNGTFASSSTAMIAPYWDDLYGGGTSSYVYRYSSGSTPNRVLTVLWYRSEFCCSSTGGELTFAAQLYENGNMRFVYDDVTGSSASWSYGISATAGIDGGSTTGYYTQLSYNSAAYLTDDKTVEFIHPNNVPVADAGSAASGDEGVAITIDAGGSSGAPSSGLTYDYDCDSDGTYEISGSSSDSYDCEYDDDGSYVATVDVNLYSILSDSDTTTVTVANVAPAPASWRATTTGTAARSGIDWTVTDIDEGDVDSLTLACVATDVAGDTVSIAMDWGDGDTTTTTSSTDESHTYVDDGTFTFTCAASDEDGGTSAEILAAIGYTLTLVVNNVAPDITVAGATDSVEGSASTFTAAASDPGDDTLTYTWDFGDGSTGTGATASHTYVDDGSYTWTLTVDDGDGGTDTSSGVGPVTISNADPVPSFTAPSAYEGVAASFAGAATDVGTADTFVYSWDFGDGSTAVGATASHTYAADGTYTATLTVDDDDGGSGSVAHSVVVGNSAPVISSTSSAATVDEGSSTTFAAAASDPGGDALTYVWDFGDGTGDTGDSVGHTYVQDGTYIVSVVVSDGVATDSESFTIEVLNLAPKVVTATGADGDEGEALAFTATASDAGTADLLTVEWDFGDGSATVGGETASHTYADNGVYSVVVTVTDDAGDSDSETISVTVGNLPPEITSVATTTGSEAVAYSYPAAAVDPGTADTHTWALDLAPSGASVDATGAVNWTPAYADVATPASFTLTVTDDDGATDSESWMVTVTALDTDADGMADGYEDANGFDKNDPTDGAGDVDADGVTNGDEAIDGTDPNVFDGPTAPVAWAPIDGEYVASVSPDLTVGNATSPRGLALTYDFEVYEDEAMTVTTTYGWDVVEGAGATSWMLDALLTDDTMYWWRAQANDGLVAGAWTDVEPFFANTIEGTPTVPVPFSPVDGGIAATVTPDLIWTLSSDDEGQALTYDVQVWDADGTAVVTEVTGVTDDAADAYGDWWVSPALTEDTWYLWTVRATDALGNQSEWAEPESFSVSTADAAPSDIAWVSPVDQEELATVSPTLEWSASVDPEGGAVSYTVEADVAPSFDSAGMQSWAGLSATTLDMVGAGESLPENTMVYLRVQGVDPATVPSAWAVIEVFVRGENDAPGVPELVTPEEGATSAAAAVLTATETTDPEGDVVSYQMVVSAAADLSAPVFSGPVPGTLTGTVSATVTPELAAGTWYWSAQAVDEFGAESGWAVAGSFVVEGADDTGTIDGDTGEDDAGDCDCNSGAGFPALLISAFAAIAATRRRK